MNKKIYFNNHYLLITTNAHQQSGNQLIVNADSVTTENIKEDVNKFIQQSDQNNLVLITKNVDTLFEFVKQQFVYIEAAGGLIEQNNKYLFIYRLNKWDLPKGKIDKGENPRQAAIRECEEECAVTGLTIIKELSSSYHIYPYKGRYALKTTYWYLMQSNYKGPLIPQTEENIEKVEWLDKKNIDQNVISNTYPSILDLISGTINN